MTVALAHGIPVVSNRGPSTVAVLDGDKRYSAAFTLAESATEDDLTAALSGQLADKHQWDRRSHAALTLYRDIFSYEVTGKLVADKLLSL